MQLEFHSGIADKLGYTCRLLRKAYRQGARLVVCAQPDDLTRLDTLLWTFEHLEFVPHARLRAGEQVAPALERTPIWLAEHEAHWPPTDAVVNLGELAIEEPQRFTRLIEIVGTEVADIQAGRARWRQYLAAGFEPKVVNAKVTAAAVEDHPNPSVQ